MMKTKTYGCLVFFGFLSFSIMSCNLPVDNVAADPSLEPYVCNQKIATAPGTLVSLPIGTAGSAQTRGYVEYVPSKYTSASKWPLIVYLHGDGELADGNSVDALAPFYYGGLTGQIHNGDWDSSDRFIVLAPQFASYADRSAVNVHDFIQYAKANYRVDVSRIYLTAVSGGGVALGNYLYAYSGGEAAAVMPVSCYVPPIDQAKKWKNVPVWLLCGAADTTVKPDNVIKVYSNLVAAGAPITPRVTLYTGVGHEAKSGNLSYAPASNDNHCETTYGGVALTAYSNVYDWLLQYHR
jgi:predicted peptidase